MKMKDCNMLLGSFESLQSKPLLIMDYSIMTDTFLRVVMCDINYAVNTINEGKTCTVLHRSCLIHEQNINIHVLS